MADGHFSYQALEQEKKAKCLAFLLLFARLLSQIVGHLEKSSLHAQSVERELNHGWWRGKTFLFEKRLTSSGRVSPERPALHFWLSTQKRNESSRIEDYQDRLSASSLYDDVDCEFSRSAREPLRINTKSQNRPTVCGVSTRTCQQTRQTSRKHSFSFFCCSIWFKESFLFQKDNSKNRNPKKGEDDQ